MKNEDWYAPIYEIRRGGVIESLHHGAIAIVDVHGHLLSSYGNPDAVTYIRSAAKPLQILPFLEQGGREFYSLTDREIALMCASHSGTDMHMAVLEVLQKKVGVHESDLLCGTHYPSDKPTADQMRRDGTLPTPNRHNCSGKHTGMLAFMRMLQANDHPESSSLQYIDPQHPVQLEIIKVFAEMCEISPGELHIGIDGCSAPNFALPLYNVALAYARLGSPEKGNFQSTVRLDACQAVIRAMTSHPDMVAGPGKFDTRIMEVCGGQILVKGGAEGYQGALLMPGVLAPGSPSVGIALKITDGDQRLKIRSAVVLEVIRQLGAFLDGQLSALETFGPRFPVVNWRDIQVGEGCPCFELT